MDGVVLVCMLQAGASMQSLVLLVWMAEFEGRGLLYVSMSLYLSEHFSVSQMSRWKTV